MGWWIWVIRSISAYISNEFAQGNCHINGIESFRSYAKRRLAKFKGVPRHTFHLHLKECEFRFYHREEKLYKEEKLRITRIRANGVVCDQENIRVDSRDS